MLFTAHILAGAAIASKIQPAPIGLVLAFFSHYFIDFFPHQEYSIKNIKEKQWKGAILDLSKVFLDSLSGFFLIFLFSENILLGISGGFTAIMPDGLTFLFYVFPNLKILNLTHQLHEKTHWFKKYETNKKIPLFWKLFSQFLIAAASIFLLLQ